MACENWSDALHRGVRKQDQHYVVDVDYLVGHVVGRGARFVRQCFGDTRQIQWYGPLRVRAWLRQLEVLAAQAPDVQVLGCTDVPPTGTASSMPSGTFGTVFGQDGIANIPWQQWAGFDGFVIEMPEEIASQQRHVIIFPEFMFLRQVRVWAQETAAVQQVAREATRFEPSLAQRIYARLWPERVPEHVCKDFLHEHPEHVVSQKDGAHYANHS